MSISELISFNSELIVFLLILFLTQLIYGRVIHFVEDRVRPILTMPIALFCALSFFCSTIYLYVGTW